MRRGESAAEVCLEAIWAVQNTAWVSSGAHCALESIVEKDGEAEKTFEGPLQEKRISFNVTLQRFTLLHFTLRKNGYSQISTSIWCVYIRGASVILSARLFCIAKTV